MKKKEEEEEKKKKKGFSYLSPLALFIRSFCMLRVQAKEYSSSRISHCNTIAASYS